METEIRKKYWPNGNLRLENLYVNGIPHGPQRSYYENGQLGGESSYKSGQWHGINKIYHRCGKIYAINTRIKNREVLRIKFYYG